MENEAMVEAVESLTGAVAVDHLAMSESSVTDVVETSNINEDIFCISRDVRDVKLIGALSIIIMSLSFILLLCVGLLIYQYFKKPTVITIVKSGDEVVSINDLTTGISHAGVSMRPGDITSDEKHQVAGELAQGIYKINPLTRDEDLKRLINLMDPATAREYVLEIKNSGLLKRQVDEKWTANWTMLDTSVVEGMPNTVRVLGRQDLIKVVGQQRIEESHTYSMDVLLVMDEKGREPRNLNTGLRVLRFTIKEIKER
jgi:hypothetical protein